MERKVPEHCPGPPTTQQAENTSEPLDINLGQQLHRKEEELQQLRQEVESYAGKLKAYQTLGMFSNVATLRVLYTHRCGGCL